jgi:ribosomal protein S18 acetylase RimI-like enzyme
VREENKGEVDLDTHYRLDFIDQNNEDNVGFLFNTRRHPEIMSRLFGKPPENLDFHREWLRNNVPSKRLIFLLKEDEVPVGYCQAYYFDGDTVEVGFVVHPDHQCRGHGSRMVKMLLNELSVRMPSKRVVLEVRTDNEKAIGLYSRHGFVTTSIHSGRMRMEIP